MNRLIPTLVLAANAGPLAAHPGADPDGVLHALLHAFDSPAWMVMAVLATVAAAVCAVRRLPSRRMAPTRSMRKR